MFSVEEVARSVTAQIDAASNISFPLLVKWVNEAYAELVARARFRHLRRVANLYVPAPYTTGIVSASTGLTLVTGNSTNWTEKYIGWQIRIQQNWYTVVAVPTSTSLIIDAPFADQTIANASYFLIQRNIPLPADARWIHTVTHPRLTRTLCEESLEWLNERYPARILVGAYPLYWCESPAYHGDNPFIGLDKRKMVEVYPPSTITENYVVTYSTVAPPLGEGDLLPPEIDPYILREGVLVYIYRHLSHSAMNQAPPQLDLAKMYMSMTTQQMVLWEQKIRLAEQADMGQQSGDIETYMPFREDRYTEPEVLFPMPAPVATTGFVIQQGSTAVGGGLFTVTVNVGATISGSYNVYVTPNWTTSYSATNLGPNTFVVNFTSAAPVGGGTIQWGVIQL